jgi:hypothetical protein
MTAPAPSPAEQATIDRFGIFDEERVARGMVCELQAGHDNPHWCRQGPDDFLVWEGPAAEGKRGTCGSGYVGPRRSVIETVARAMCKVTLPVAGGYLHMNLNADQARRLAAAAVAAYRRATQDGGAEEAVDANGCPDRQHHGVDCPGDACRYAALAPQAGDGAR